MSTPPGRGVNPLCVNSVSTLNHSPCVGGDVGGSMGDGDMRDADAIEAADDEVGVAASGTASSDRGEAKKKKKYKHKRKTQPSRPKQDERAGKGAKASRST